MKRGEVWLTDFSVGVKSEIVDKTSPALIISNTEINQWLTRVVVVPLLDVIDPKPPSQITITLEVGKEQTQIKKTAVTDKIKAVDKTRLKKLWSTTSSESIEKVGRALVNYLALPHLEVIETLADPVEELHIKSVVNKLFVGPLF